MGPEGILDPKNFAGLEYLREIFRCVGKFIHLASQKDFKPSDKELIQALQLYDNLFDKQVGLDLLLEDLTCKMIYSHDYQEDLF